LLVTTGLGLAPWQDPTLSTAERVDNLVSLLSLDEKVSLLSSANPPVARIGLPGYSFGRECEGGDTSGHLGTAYPAGLAFAASFDPQLVAEVAFQTAIEVRGNANANLGTDSFGSSCFGPVSNLIRDSRWGRTSEMIGGEDPTLGRIMSGAFTRGIQHGYDNASKLRMVNTIAKHLNTYGGPEGWGGTFGPHAERFNFEAVLSEREWREFFLPPFQGSADAGVTGFMCSYSSITLTDNLGKSHNTPSCANEYLLTDIIRKEWNWTGYILSDAGATAFIANTTITPGKWHDECPDCIFGHGYAANSSDAAIKAISSGMDLELTCCGAPEVFPSLSGSVRSGKLAEAVVDRSLKRTLPYRFEIGQLDPPATQRHNPYNGRRVGGLVGGWWVDGGQQAGGMAVAPVSCRMCSHRRLLPLPCTTLPAPRPVHTPCRPLGGQRLHSRADCARAQGSRPQHNPTEERQGRRQAAGPSLASRRAAREDSLRAGAECQQHPKHDWRLREPEAEVNSNDLSRAAARTGQLDGGVARGLQQHGMQQLRRTRRDGAGLVLRCHGPCCLWTLTRTLTHPTLP
jgi:beta-glucosidase